MIGPIGWGGGSSADDLALLLDGIHNHDSESSNSQQFRIHGLPPGHAFGVCLISSNNLSDNQRTKGVWTTPNISTINQSTQVERTVGHERTETAPATVDNTGGPNGKNFVQGNNYVFFESLVVDENGELIFDGTSTNQSPVFNNRLPLNGFQIFAS